MQPDIKERAQGRWRDILLALGMDRGALSGKHGPCPICREGADRFRFDDRDGRGTFICSRCGAGNGVDLVMKWKRVDFLAAKALIEAQIGAARFEAPKVAHRDEAREKASMTALWARGRALDGQDVASRYLHGRGIDLAAYGPSLRVVDDLAYQDGDGAPSLHPGMLAKFVAPDEKSAILHRTFLAEPGRKADVAQPRKMMRGTIPRGGAVRLAPAGETLGIAEGIETALAALLIAGVPVWAATNANLLIQWEPPAIVRHVIVFADNDPSYCGQNAAYSLAYRLACRPPDKRIGVEVRLPQYWDRGEKEDWNDVRISELRRAA
ncbi:MAG TPA: toprim domain-containing protein [Xanthobacteraceae bacterium]|nr:toprim domain-containing protein [Xanthobacteraceae bacterium]